MPRVETVNVENIKPVDLTKSFTAIATDGTNYQYSASDELRIFLRFNNTITNLSNYASNDTITLSYTNQGADNTDNLIQQSELIGERNVETFFAEVKGGGGAQGNTGLLEFGGASTPTDNIITFGDGSSDSPFSVSFWIRYAEAPPGGARILFEKGRFESSAADKEYRLEYSDAGNTISFRLYDHNNSNAECVKIWVSQDLSGNEWKHVVITYDGHGSGAPQDEHMTLYVNGVDQESSVGTRTDGSYQFMDPASDELHIGSDHKAQTESDSFMAEFAIWGKELSTTEVNAIYYAQLDATETTTTQKSGYVGLPPRVKIRELDNKLGSYPTIKRLGDADRRGNVSKKPFDDRNTLVFGRKIKDDFSSSGVNNNTILDRNKWSSSKGLKVRNELIKESQGQIRFEKSLVFEGSATNRFIQTADKIKNPTIRMKLQQGPYNNVKGGLNLKKGSLTDVLKVQISADGSTWIDVKTFTPTQNLESFYGIENIKQNVYKKLIKLSTQSFPNISSDFYLKIVQDSVSNPKEATWALSEIEITFANQSITYGLNSNVNIESGKRLSGSLISTPHVLNNLTGIGIVRRGISDTMLSIDSIEENITPFNEKQSIFNANEEFFNIGTDPSIIPGYSRPAKNKTIFTVDLSVNEQTTFGNTGSYGDGSEEVNPEHKLMTYYNHALRRWEKIGDTGLFLGYTLDAIDINKNTFAQLMISNSNAPVGFGPMPSVYMTASNKSTDTGISGMPLTNQKHDVTFVNDDYFSATCLPIDSFGFPFTNQYHATSSQLIKASDLGITKPFLLEKCSLSFDSNFEFKERETPFQIGFNFSDSGTRVKTQYNGFQSFIIIPSFFMLRQSNVKVNKVFERTYKNTRAHAGLTSHKIFRKITSGSREMITYGQVTIITSGSDHNAKSATQNLAGVNLVDVPQQLLDRGLGRDASFIDTSDDDGVPESISGSFTMNFPCRTTPRYDDFNPLGIIAEGTNGVDSVLLGDTTFGRGNNLESINRGIVNSTGPRLPGEALDIPQASTFTTNGDLIIANPPSKETVDLTSPYIIFPEDQLIFGWQYPLGAKMVQDGKTTADDSRRDTMTLLGNSKLKLFGSLISNATEFHETINQNLTSDNVYETIINNEKIIDQWQIETKSEYSGSFLDNHFRNNTKKRLSRIGLTVNSAVSGEAGVTGSFSRLIHSNDQERIFEDSNSKAASFYDNTQYGTMNTEGNKLSPKYYYNSNHFGYSIDLIRQSIDTKYARIDKTLDEDQIVSTLSPIAIKFVISEVIDQPEIRVYKKEQIDNLLNTKQFQSSNISIFSTSSIPFIDDNTPRNRNYVEADFVAV
jgi:hypothetical protein